MKIFSKKVNSVLSLLLIVFFICACKKQDVKGPQGDPGPNGTGGNSSISSSNVFVVDSLDWQKGADGKSWEASVSQPLITQSVVDKGAVKVYVQLNNYWWQLPYSIADYVTQFSFKLGVLQFTIIDVEGFLPPKPSRSNYRLVVLSEA